MLGFMPKSIELLTKQLAADRLNLSVRRLMELSADDAEGGAILTRHRAFDPETKREAFMFAASEVEALKKKWAATPAPGAVAVRPRIELDADDNEPAVSNNFRLWLTLSEAAEYSGLPASILQAMIESGELRALNVGVRPGGHWRVRKADVDAVEGKLSRI